MVPQQSEPLFSPAMEGGKRMNGCPSEEESGRQHYHRRPKSLEAFVSPETKDGRGWKNRLRMRCMERIRTNREKILQDIRGISPCSTSSTTSTPMQPTTPGVMSSPSPVSRTAMSILDEEMDVEGAGEEGGPSSVETEASVLSVEEYMELMQAIEEALTEEMRLAEQGMAEEFYRVDEHHVDALYDDEDQLPEDVVLCPACKRNYLLEDGTGTIVCACGLSIESVTEVLSLSDLRERLARTYSEHRRGGCVMAVEPCFHVTTDFGASTLHAQCDFCGYRATVT